MKKNAINPWQWQENFSFSQAIAVSGEQQTLYCSGQAATDPEGSRLYKGDMRAQVQQALDNLYKVLAEGGYNWSNIVRLTIYTTSTERFFNEYGLVMTRLASAVPKPAITLVGVHHLAFPELLVELEATAVK